MDNDRVEFLPIMPRSSVIENLNELIRNSLFCRGIVSFWSINHRLLDSTFIQKISGEGYLCVDIHRPTNVYSICGMADKGASVFFHLYDIKGQSEPMGTFGVHDYLMHSKILVFQMPEDKAVIWIGSHNGTNRAMHGINIESSVLIYTNINSKIYFDVVCFLDIVRLRCKAVDPDLLDYYKWLQGESNDRSIIEVIDLDNILNPGSQFALFIKSEDDVQGLQKVGNDVLISVTDALGSEIFYKAVIGQSGELHNYPSMGDVDIHAIRASKKIPTIKNSKPDQEAKKSAYCVVFRLETMLPSHMKVVELSGDRWSLEEEISIKDELVAPPELMKVKRIRTSNPSIKIKEAIPFQDFKHINRQAKKRIKDTNRPLITKVSIIKKDGNEK